MVVFFDTWSDTSILGGNVAVVYEKMTYTA